jgi:hypothetical protein
MQHLPLSPDCQAAGAFFGPTRPLFSSLHAILGTGLAKAALWALDPHAQRLAEFRAQGDAHHYSTRILEPVPSPANAWIAKRGE